jgi:hypothetical protein
LRPEAQRPPHRQRRARRYQRVMVPRQKTRHCHGIRA